MGALFLQNLISHIMMMDLGFIFTFLSANFSAVDFFFVFAFFCCAVRKPFLHCNFDVHNVI